MSRPCGSHIWLRCSRLVTALNSDVPPCLAAAEAVRRAGGGDQTAEEHAEHQGTAHPRTGGPAGHSAEEPERVRGVKSLVDTLEALLENFERPTSERCCPRRAARKRRWISHPAIRT